MKVVRLLLFPLLLAGLVLPVTSCGSGAKASSASPTPTPSPTSPLKTYADKTYGFSISYDPRLFSVDVSRSDKSYYGVVLNAIATKRLIPAYVGDGVKVQASKPIFSGTQYMEGMANGAYGGHVTWTTFAGVRAFRVEAAGRQFTQLDIGLARGDVYYQIEALSRTKDWPRLRPAVYALLASFRLIR